MENRKRAKALTIRQIAQKRNMTDAQLHYWLETMGYIPNRAERQRIARHAERQRKANVEAWRKKGKRKRQHTKHSNISFRTNVPMWYHTIQSSR